MSPNRILCLISSVAVLGAAPKSFDVASDALKDRVFTVSPTSNPLVIDGEFDEKEWASAASTDFFLEFQPGENVDPPDSTEVRLIYDKQHLYVGFMAYADPTEIRASIQKRDRAWRDDFVAILIDTYGDANTAVMIAANPYGIQMDALNQGGGEDDASYDIIFESKGKITDEGYQVEMAIPFSSLSFPEGDRQEWKVNFFRNLPRDSRHMIVWGGLDRSNPCWLCQFGTLKGIEGIEREGKLEFLPTVVGSQASSLGGDDQLKAGKPAGEASLGVKYSFSSDRSVELTLNPDFSQVEADEERIDVNTTFALYYPEKRPFFNEGADLIADLGAIYTRSINNPIGAGRIINRGQKDSWMFLSAFDEDSPYIVPGEEKSFTRTGGNSLSNVFRYKRSLREGSFLGLLATDRRMTDNAGSGSVAGIDGRYRFNDMYLVEFEAMFSATQEPDDSLLVSSDTFGDGHTFTFDGESFSGNSMALQFERATKHWRLETRYSHKTPTFRAENGFESQNDSRELSAESLWRYYPNNFFSEVMGFVLASVQHNSRGEQKAQFVYTFVILEMPRQTRLHVSYAKRFQYRFKETELHGLYDLRLNLNSQFSERYQFGLNVGRHVAPIRILAVPVEGRLFSHGLFARVQASDRLNVGLSYSNQLMTTLDRESDYYDGFVGTVRASYQHNKALGVKVLGQYNDFSKTFQIQPLLTYQPSPFTIFYIGSTSNQNVGQFALDAIQDGLLTNRQYFLKIQYLFN